MSRGQMGQVFGTAQGENKTYNTMANTSFGNAQGDVGSYADEVGAFKAANPYVQGGAVQTAENQQLADTAAGEAESMGQAVQGAAVRTGQNPAGAIAATEDVATRNARALSADEAAATERRAAAGTGYGEAVLGGKAKTAEMQDQLAREESGAAQGALGTETTAAQMPSFMDELGQGLITAGTNFAGGFGTGMGIQAGKNV